MRPVAISRREEMIFSSPSGEWGVVDNHRKVCIGRYHFNAALYPFDLLME